MAKLYSTSSLRCHTFAVGQLRHGVGRATSYRGWILQQTRPGSPMREPVSRIRDLLERGDEKAATLAKRGLPGWAVSALFDEPRDMRPFDSYTTPRLEELAIGHTGVLGFDVDRPVDAEAEIASLRDWPAVCFVVRSARGVGYKFGVRVDGLTLETHAAAWEWVRGKVVERLRVVDDSSARNLGRVFFCSWDPRGWWKDVEKPLVAPEGLTRKPRPTGSAGARRRHDGRQLMYPAMVGWLPRIGAILGGCPTFHEEGDYNDWLSVLCRLREIDDVAPSLALRARAERWWERGGMSRRGQRYAVGFDSRWDGLPAPEDAPNHDASDGELQMYVQRVAKRLAIVAGAARQCACGGDYYDPTRYKWCYGCAMRGGSSGRPDEDIDLT